MKEYILDDGNSVEYKFSSEKKAKNKGKKLVTDFRNVKGIMEVDSLGNKVIYPFDVRFIRKNRRYYWIDNEVIAMDSDYDKLDEEAEIPDVYEDGYHILGKEYVEDLKAQ